MLGKILFLFGITLLLFGTLKGRNSVKSYFELKHSKEVLEEAVNKLKNQNSYLASEILKIKTSPYYAKKVLVEKYNHTEPDEVIIFLEDE